MADGVGYIFNKNEIAYISSIMGADHIINVDIEFTEEADLVVEKAEKSLLEKNYVFRNFDGELVLNKEFVKYFQPLILPLGLIACRRIIEGTETNFIFFTRYKEWLCMEKDDNSGDNYILTYNSEYKSIRKSLEDIIQIVETKNDKLFSKFIMNANQYRMLNDLAYKKDEKGMISILKEIGAEYNDDLINEFENMYSNDAQIISMVFFSDYRNNPLEMKCLTYYLTEQHIWKVDAADNNIITISCILKNDIKRNILSMLSSEFSISDESADPFL